MAEKERQRISQPRTKYCIIHSKFETKLSISVAVEPDDLQPRDSKLRLKPNPPNLGQAAFAESSRPVDIPESFLLSQTLGSWEEEPSFVHRPRHTGLDPQKAATVCELQMIVGAVPLQLVSAG